MPATYSELAHGRRSTPSPAEQRELFEFWFYGEAHQAYRRAKSAGGGALPAESEAFELFARRWKPVR